MPSMPRWYEIPKPGIQARTSSNWKAATASSKPTKSDTESRNATRLTASPPTLKVASVRRGTKSRTRAPSAGRNVTAVNRIVT